MVDIHTYPEMNAKIVRLLRTFAGDDPTPLYAAKRIEELESDAECLAWVGDNFNNISIAVFTDGQVQIYQAQYMSRTTFDWFPTKLAALRDLWKQAKEAE